MAKNTTIKLTEKEAQALWMAIDGYKNCFSYDHEFDAEERREMQALDRIINKVFNTEEN